jgi:hypothetical protein
MTSYVRIHPLEIRMRRTASLVLAIAASVALAGSALAANPHYVGPKTPQYSINTSTGGLIVNFKAAGYGSGQQVDYSASFTYAITWGCITPPRSNEPKGLQTTSGDTTSSGTLTASRTGTLSGPLTLFQGVSFSCPSHNQHEVLISASYSNIMFNLEGIDPFGPSSVSYTR